MSDVKRYHVTEAGLVEGQALGRINVVLGSDYDTAVAVGTAFGNTLERVVAERDALQVLLIAADERADVLEGLLHKAHPFTNDVAHDPDVWMEIEAALNREAAPAAVVEFAGFKVVSDPSLPPGQIRMCDCNQGRLPCTCRPSAYDGFDNGVD